MVGWLVAVTMITQAFLFCVLNLKPINKLRMLTLLTEHFQYVVVVDVFIFVN